MFLGVAGHAVAEARPRRLDGAAVDEVALVEAVHLLLEVGRMVVIKLRFLFDLEGLDVSAEEEEVVDAEEVEVDQRILRLVLGETLADDVGDGGDAVFILNGGGDGDGADGRGGVFGGTVRPVVEGGIRRVCAGEGIGEGGGVGGAS